jgi:hypothetical protein
VENRPPLLWPVEEWHYAEAVRYELLDIDHLRKDAAHYRSAAYETPSEPERSWLTSMARPTAHESLNG